MYTWIHTGEKSCCDSSALFVFNGSEMMHKNCMFLAHLSRRLMGELIVYQSRRRPSVVSPSTISNIFSSQTTGPIELKFHMKTPSDAGMKVCSNGPGHMTKMAATPI